jgi:hypothetical protein
MKPPTSGPTAAAIAGGSADERVRTALHRALEVAVDQRLHRRQEQRRAQPADDRPADDDRQQALRERHRERARRVPEQAEDVGALAAEQVGDLAPDQDERGRDERLQRNRRLDAARRGVKVVDDRRDRDVHQRGVDDEHEHRHREEDRQPLVAARLLRNGRHRLNRQRRLSRAEETWARGVPPLDFRTQVQV